MVSWGNGEGWRKKDAKANPRKGIFRGKFVMGMSPLELHAMTGGILNCRNLSQNKDRIEGRRFCHMPLPLNPWVKCDSNGTS
ncbi:MAG: hypothetical protein WCO57_14045, partial [Verrucomicrobiota bacterium]